MAACYGWRHMADKVHKLGKHNYSTTLLYASLYIRKFIVPTSVSLLLIYVGSLCEM